MKKVFITLAAVAGIMAAATTAQAAGISLEEAQKKALDAVSVKAEQVIFKPAEKEFDDGQEFYEVDFFIPGEVKYEFDIDVNTGAITEQSIEMWEAEDDFEYADLIKSAEMTAGFEASTEEIGEGEITELQAKMIALKDAGFKADEVTFTKCKKDFDDGMMKYEIEIRLADGTEFDYDINAADGTIFDKDMDMDD